MFADSYLPFSFQLFFQLVEVAIPSTRSVSTNLAFDHQSTLMASVLTKGLLTTFELFAFAGVVGNGWPCFGCWGRSLGYQFAFAFAFDALAVARLGST